MSMVQIDPLAFCGEIEQPLFVSTSLHIERCQVKHRIKNHRLNTGLRFSINAAIPSMESGVSRLARTAAVSSAMDSSRVLVSCPTTALSIDLLGICDIQLFLKVALKKLAVGVLGQGLLHQPNITGYLKGSQFLS